MTDTCSTCRFCDYSGGECELIDGEAYQRLGQCRRFPLCARQLIVENDGKDEFLSPMQGWPLVVEDEWCGEWRQAEELTCES